MHDNMDTTMEQYRAIAARTVEKAKERKDRLVEDGFRCHDARHAKATDLTALLGELDALLAHRPRLAALQCSHALAWMDGMLAALQQEVTRRQQEIDTLNGQMTRLKAELEQQQCILACACDDPELPVLCLRYELEGMAAETKWEKDVIIAILCRYSIARNTNTSYKVPAHLAEQWSEEAPASVRDDRDITICRLAAIRNYPNTEELSIYVPEHLWQDKGVVCAAVELHPQFLFLHNNIVPTRFLSDVDVFLAFAESKYSRRLWKEDYIRGMSCFSHEILSNASLMLLLVKKCIACFHHIDESLKGNIDIIRAASVQSFAAWQDCPPCPAKEELSIDKAFMLHLLDQLSRRSFPSDARKLYRSLPEFLQHDSDVLRVVLKRRIFTAGLLPATAPTSREFWLDAVGQLNYDVWSILPPQFRTDPEFLKAFRFDCVETFHRVLQEYPQLASNQEFWTSVILSENIFESACLAVAPPAIRQDRNLMCLACREDHPVYRTLAHWLKSDRDILTAAVEGDQDVIFHIPPEVQTMHPDLVAKAIQGMDPLDDNMPVESRHIAPGLLENDVDIAKAFLANHFDCHWEVEDFPEQIPQEVKNNEEIVLFAARYIRSPSELKQYSSESLRSNKEFMLKVVAMNPIFRAACVGKLSRDPDIALVAFSQEIFVARKLIGVLDEDVQNYDYGPELEYLHSFAVQAREKVVTFKGFTQAFLFGLIDDPFAVGPNCHLQMLNQDIETTTKLKQSIADFAGVPPSKDLDRLWAVSLNILFM